MTYSPRNVGSLMIIGCNGLLCQYTFSYYIMHVPSFGNIPINWYDTLHVNNYYSTSILATLRIT